MPSPWMEMSRVFWSWCVWEYLISWAHVNPYQYYFSSDGNTNQTGLALTVTTMALNEYYNDDDIMTCLNHYFFLSSPDNGWRCYGYEYHKTYCCLLYNICLVAVSIPFQTIKKSELGTEQIHKNYMALLNSITYNYYWGTEKNDCSFLSLNIYFFWFPWEERKKCSKSITWPLSSSPLQFQTETFHIQHSNYDYDIMPIWRWSVCDKEIKDEGRGGQGNPIQSNAGSPTKEKEK